MAKQAADAQRRATQAAQQAENALRNAQRQTEQAQTNADKNPENQGLINALNQAKARQKTAQENVDVAKENSGCGDEVSREAAEAAKSDGSSGNSLRWPLPIQPPNWPTSIRRRLQKSSKTWPRRRMISPQSVDWAGSFETTSCSAGRRR